MDTDPRVAKGARELRFLGKWTSASPRGHALDEARESHQLGRAASHLFDSGISSGSQTARYGKVGCMAFFVAVSVLLVLAIRRWLVWVLLGPLALFYLYCTALLAFSPNISAWMRAQRELSRRVDDMARRRGRRRR